MQNFQVLRMHGVSTLRMSSAILPTTFSGPGTASGQVCVSMFRTITFKLDDLSLNIWQAGSS